MHAIKQIINVKDHKFSVVLPDDFTATTVEVIILPSNQVSEVSNWQLLESERRYKEYLKNPESVSDFQTFCRELEAEI